MSRANVFRLGFLLAAGAAVAVWPNACGRSSSTALPNGADLRTEIVATGFDTIWELAWGPDGAIWVTERPGRISRVNPATGETTKVGDVAVSESGEGGLMGLAFHPDFATEPWVYVAHTYEAGTETRNRVVRMRFDGSTLGPPQVIVDDIPGSSNHNGSRVVVGPDRLLYVTTGDATNAVLAQDKSSLAGKILRLTLDGAPAPGNPFGSRIFSYGHRNPQGLVFAPNGTLYETEHGPNDNDEVNRIEAGRNYGWPGVHGRCDNDINPGETAFCQAKDVVESLAQWTPTIAPAGLDYYNSSRIPSWNGSLLFTTLKGAALYRLTLSADGRSVTSQERLFADSFGRLRDVLVAPDGTVYLGTSNKDGRGSILAQDDKIIRVVPK
jgi:glucose/arabinose dehydrogenase